jgi:hypothetical protein
MEAWSHLKVLSYEQGQRTIFSFPFNVSSKHTKSPTSIKILAKVHVYFLMWWTGGILDFRELSLNRASNTPDYQSPDQRLTPILKHTSDATAVLQSDHSSSIYLCS